MHVRPRIVGEELIFWWNILSPKERVNGRLFFTRPVLHFSFVAIGILVAFKSKRRFRPTHWRVSRGLIEWVAGFDDAYFGDRLRPNGFAAGPERHQAQTGHQQDERHHGDAIVCAGAHAESVHAEQKALQPVFFLLEEQQRLGQFCRAVIHVPAPIVPLRQEVFQTFVLGPFLTYRECTRDVAVIINLVVPNMVDMAAMGHTTVDAEDRMFIPGNFPCDITSAGLAEESATADGMDFFLFAIEADGPAG